MHRLFPCLILLLCASCAIPTEDIDSRHVFTQTEVRNAITSQIRSPYLTVELYDWRYLGYTREELYDILAGFEPVQDVRFISDYRDCDNFAWFLRGNITFLYPGILFGLVEYRVAAGRAPHLANVFLDTNLDVYILDFKQTGNILWDVDPSFLYYKVEI